MAYREISSLTARPASALVLRYGLAVTSVATVLGTTLILEQYSSPPRFISHFTLIAIAITFWWGGTGPGVLSLVLSSVGVSLLARNNLLLPGFPLGPFLLFYAGFSLLVGWFSSAGRRAERLVTEARNDLEVRVAERTNELVRANEELQNTQAELRSREAYLAEAQRLSHTGSFGWKVSSGEILWSEETFQIFQYDRTVKPTVELAIERVHPEDAAFVKQIIEKASRDGRDFDFEHRLVMPDRSIKYVHVVAHALIEKSGSVEFVGAVMDITAAKEAFEEIWKLRDQLYRENIALKAAVDQASMFEEIIGSSKALREVLSQVARVAPTDSTVLILGETGTGKELIARAIHKRSNRSDRAFIRVNCSAIPPSLIASELFGHEKGAFTGATQRHLGYFEMAGGGTIFLDEVGELPSDTQIALLRVLQEREIERVGSTKPIPVDVRVIAATNRNLKAATTNGAFRLDLFYRLNVFPIAAPPLRERKDDLLLLLEYFIERCASKSGKSFVQIDKRTLELFHAYDWPGNIRELQNVVERSVILSSGGTFSVDEAWLSPEANKTQSAAQTFNAAKFGSHEEREIIEAALRETRGRVSGPKGAAAKLRIPPSTLEWKIKALNISKKQFKFS